MFTGIVETIGVITNIEKEGTNIHFTIKSDFTSELKIDQSVAHNGVCLTVVAIKNQEYIVTAIDETLQKTTLSNFKIGDTLNLERGMKLGDRLDGHLVQGHVDQIATCINFTEEGGSWVFTFEYDSSLGNVTIEKGSITVNGISLTVLDSKEKSFSVAVIPYTYENTTLHNVNKGDIVNLEFDVIGKYVTRLQQKRVN